VVGGRGCWARSRCRSMCRNWFTAPTCRTAPRHSCASLRKVVRPHGTRRRIDQRNLWLGLLQRSSPPVSPNTPPSRGRT
jgi:hypothetical protein